MDDGINAWPHSHEATILSHRVILLTLALDLYQELQQNIGVIAYIFNPNTQQAEAGQQVHTSLGYIVSFKLALVT